MRRWRGSSIWQRRPNRRASGRVPVLDDLVTNWQGTMSIAGVLFDKDGTLIDFEATWHPVYQKGRAPCGRW